MKHFHAISKPIQKHTAEVFRKKKGVLRKFAKFTRKHLCQGLFFNKVAGLRPATLLKKRLWHRCFPVNFANFLRTPFLQNTSGGCFCQSTMTVATSSIYHQAAVDRMLKQLSGGVMQSQKTICGVAP